MSWPYIAEPLWQLAIPIDSLAHDPANARKHGEKNMEAIRSSLAAFGQQRPIWARKGPGGLVVRAGNGTLAAARALGWSHIAVVQSDMDEAAATAYAIADNRTAELAEWDDPVLADLWAGLDKSMQAAAGFTEEDLKDLLKAGDDLADALGDLPDGDKGKLGQKTFVLTDDQLKTVEAAVERAKDMGGFPDTGNENANGNALERICEAYLT